MLSKLDSMLEEKGIDVKFESLLPRVLLAGEYAGRLTEEGAKLLDPAGNLRAGALLCPPEGDVGTGMVATNSVRPRTANISAGTSAFLMVALENPLSTYYKEIDVVASPAADPVAMVHVNNFTTEITAWANLFEEVIALAGGDMSRGKLFDAMFKSSLRGSADCGGLMGYNFLAGEPVVGVKNGTTLITRAPEGQLTLASFMKMQIYSALGALAIGCEMLDKESVAIDSVCGHGGFFKTPDVGQSSMSAALGAPVTVMQTAGEGGAWGIAVLALFATTDGQSLSDFLDGVFADAEKHTVSASDDEIADFGAFMEKFKSGIAVQKFASEVL
jgi:sugar (pentulose or hexulose) kinase